MSGIPRSTPLANLDQVIRLREGIFLTTLKELAQPAANSHRVRCSTTKTSGGTTLESVTYTYDALGNRIGMDENGTQTWTLYEGSDPIMDFNGSGSLTMRYLWGPTGIVASQTSGGTISWYLADALGSVRDLINNSGAIIDHIDFSAFGTILDQSDPSDGDRMMGFAGMELDAVTGLNLAVYREENPGTGRWNSQDPLGFGGGDANLYCYVADNPANANDPARAGRSCSSSPDSVPGARRSRDSVREPSGRRPGERCIPTRYGAMAAGEFSATSQGGLGAGRGLYGFYVLCDYPG